MPSATVLLMVRKARSLSIRSSATLSLKSFRLRAVAGFKFTSSAWAGVSASGRGSRYGLRGPCDGNISSTEHGGEVVMFRACKCLSDMSVGLRMRANSAWNLGGGDS